MITLILIFLAGMANAMCDTLKDHWYMFRWKDKVTGQWWNPEHSWKNKHMKKGIDVRYEWYYSIVQLSDAWHLFKTIWIFLICGAVVTCGYLSPIHMVTAFALCGFTWNIGFSLGYNWLFVKK